MGSLSIPCPGAGAAQGAGAGGPGRGPNSALLFASAVYQQLSGLCHCFSLFLFFFWHAFFVESGVFWVGCLGFFSHKQGLCSVSFAASLTFSPPLAAPRLGQVVHCSFRWHCFISLAPPLFIFMLVYFIIFLILFFLFFLFCFKFLFWIFHYFFFPAVFLSFFPLFFFFYLFFPAFFLFSFFTLSLFPFFFFF